MLIKIVYSGRESGDWIALTKKTSPSSLSRKARRGCRTYRGSLSRQSRSGNAYSSNFRLFLDDCTGICVGGKQVAKVSG